MQEVLQVAERSLKRHHLDEHTPATKYDLRHIRVMEGELRRKGQTDEEERNGGVHFGDVSERDRDPFGAGATSVRAGTRDHGAEERDESESTQLQSCQTNEVSSDEGPGAGRIAAGQVVQHDRVGEDHDGQHEVESDEIGIELEEHDQAAEHDLSHDAGNQPRTEQGEVPAWWRAERCHGEGGDRYQSHCKAHEPVGELDDRMERGHGRQVVLEARGPVGAPEPGARQPHCAAAHHQQRVADHRNQGHLAYGGG